jgi:hypothetical protein
LFLATADLTGEIPKNLIATTIIIRAFFLQQGEEKNWDRLSPKNGIIKGKMRINECFVVCDDDRFRQILFFCQILFLSFC